VDRGIADGKITQKIELSKIALNEEGGLNNVSKIS
jgi:hypothetical protein